jgi:hypothetical protein
MLAGIPVTIAARLLSHCSSRAFLDFCDSPAVDAAAERGAGTMPQFSPRGRSDLFSRAYAMIMEISHIEMVVFAGAGGGLSGAESTAAESDSAER